MFGYYHLNLITHNYRYRRNNTLQYLKTYLNTISKRGNIQLAESILKTAEDAMFFVRTSIPTFIGVGINVIMSAYYTSVQKAGASAIVAALRSMILPILLVLTLSNIFGFIGLVLVLPISEVVTLLVSCALYKNRSADILLTE